MGSAPGGGGDQFGLPGPGQFEEGGKEVVGIALPLTGLFGDLGQHGPLPLPVQNGQVVFILIGGDLIGQIHPLEEELQELVVHLVNVLANFRKFHDCPPIVSLREPPR